MALQFSVDSLEGMDESLHGLYTEKDGKFFLSVEGLPKVDNSLAERLSKLEANNQALLAEKMRAKADAEQARLDAAKAGGDIEAIEKSWQEKMDSALLGKDTELATFAKMVESLTVGSSSTSIASEVFGEHAELMKHHVDSRLSVEIVDGKPKVRVMGLDGKPSAMSVDELKAEISGNEKFAPFVVGSRASGAGSHGGKSTGGAKVLTRTAFNQLDPNGQMEHAKNGGTLVD